MSLPRDSRRPGVSLGDIRNQPIHPGILPAGSKPLFTNRFPFVPGRAQVLPRPPAVVAQPLR